MRRRAGLGHRPGRLLDGLRARHALATAHAPQAWRSTSIRSSRVRPSASALQVAVLVEQPRVEVEDALADRVEAEVPRLDDAGVDRADGDLVDVVAGDGGGPRAERARDGTPGAAAVVPGEVDAVEVVRLALVPREVRAGDRRPSARTPSAAGQRRIRSPSPVGAGVAHLARAAGAGARRGRRPVPPPPRTSSTAPRSPAGATTRRPRVTSDRPEQAQHRATNRGRRWASAVQSERAWRPTRR